MQLRALDKRRIVGQYGAVDAPTLKLVDTALAAPPTAYSATPANLPNQKTTDAQSGL